MIQMNNNMLVLNYYEVYLMDKYNDVEILKSCAIQAGNNGLTVYGDKDDIVRVKNTYTVAMEAYETEEQINGY